MRIAEVVSYHVFDSRGHPTVETLVRLADGSTGRGTAPAGASTGQHESLELRDGGTRFAGLGVFRAVENVNAVIAPRIKGFDAFDQTRLDASLNEWDGTPRKEKLGANAILSVSMAVAQAAAASRRQPLFEYLGRGEGVLLPLPEIQLFGGGRHAAGRLDIQDVMIVPVSATSFEQCLEMVAAVYHHAGRIMAERGALAGVADEGGYWPNFENNEAALSTTVQAIERAGYNPGRDVAISLDIAASTLRKNGTYQLARERRSLDAAGMVELLSGWCDRYPIVSLEDPVADDDDAGWKIASDALAKRCQLIGDDLFVTNVARIEEGIRRGIANAVLIKLNQVGTLTETLRAMEVTRSAGWRPVVSARSGETEDTFISHLAVATNAGQLKVGSFTRGERTAKWNEVLRIHQHLGNRAKFIGGKILANPAATTADHFAP